MRTGDQIIRVNVSMVSLKWGDAISVLLPGALALFALAGFFPALDARISNIEQIGTAFGFALLMVVGVEWRTPWRYHPVFSGSGTG